MNTKYLAKASIIAATYVIITFVLRAISFGPIQFRVSEALAMLPYIEPAAVPGVFVGCLISNIFGGYELVDIFGGSLITLLAAYLTSRIKNKYIAALPPVLMNGFGVALWVSYYSNIPYVTVALSISISQAIVLYGIGVPLLKIYKKLTDKYTSLHG